MSSRVSAPDPERFGNFAPILLFNLVNYLCIGIPLAVIPGFVHDTLGMGVVMAGAAVSLQYLATLVSRVMAGKISDTRGPKFVVTLGLRIGALSGILMLGASLAVQTVWLSLTLLAAARLAVGTGQSMMAIGATTWSLGRTGPGAIGKVISWSGVTSYGGLAIGAPAGVLLVQTLGWNAVGVTIFLLCSGAWLLARRTPGVALIAGTRIGFAKVFVKMAPYGLCLAAGATGFGAITSFVTLYYARQGWDNPALALSVLGGTFVLARLLLGNAITRFGGYQVALASLAVESIGLGMLWLAPTPAWALAGVALTGFGFSQVFPSMGVEAVRLVPDNNRGSALASYNLFMDLSLGVVGPVAGFIAGGYGYASVYLCAAVTVLAGLAYVARLRHLNRAPPTAPS